MDALAPQPPEEREGRGLPILCLLAPLIFLAQYSLRTLDDNTLVSWPVVFADGTDRTASAFVLICLASALAAWLSRRALPGPGVQSAAAFVLPATFWGQPEVIVDASRYFAEAKYALVHGPGAFLADWGGAVEPWTDMPLMPLLYGLGMKVFGESRIVIQAMNTGMFSLAVWCTVRLGSDLFDPETGRTGGLFVMAVPFLYTQTPLVMVDVPAMGLLMLALYTANRAFHRGGALSIALAGAAMALAFFAKYSQGIMLTSLGALALLYVHRRPRSALMRGAGILAVFGLIAAPVLHAYRDVVAAQLDLLMAYQRPGLERWTESFAGTLLFHVHPALIALALVGTWRGVRERDGRLLAVAWALVLVLGLMQVRRIRYVIPLMPLLGLMAAYGLMALRGARLRRLVALLAVGSALAVAWGGYLPFLRTNSLVNLQTAARAIDAHPSADVLVVALPQRSIVNPALAVPLLDLYTHKRVLYDYTLVPIRPTEEIMASPFRFTWTYRNPAYYLPAEGVRPGLIAVVHDEPVEVAARWAVGYREIGFFDTHEGLYRYRPLVSLFSRE